MSVYPNRLIRLRGDPLAWHFQAEIRRSLFATLGVCRTMVELTNFIHSFVDSAVQPFSPDTTLNLLSRVVEHIQEHPVVNIENLRRARLTLQDVGLDNFYREAWLEFIGARPIAISVFGCPEDETHAYIKVRRDVPKQEQMAAISKALDMQESAFGQRRWQLRPATLCSYGVIQFVDLLLYTRHNRITLDRSMVETLVLDRWEPHTGGSHRVEQAPLRDLKATEHKADIFLDEGSLPAVNLRREAVHALFEYWKRHDGAGDGKFVLGADEARQLVGT